MRLTYADCIRLIRAAAEASSFASVRHVSTLFNPAGQTEGLAYPACIIELEAAARHTQHQRNFDFAIWSLDMALPESPDEGTVQDNRVARLSSSLQRLELMMGQLYQQLQALATDTGDTVLDATVLLTWTALPRVEEGADLYIGWRAELTLSGRYELPCDTPANPEAGIY